MGQHLFVRLEGCPAELLDNPELAREVVCAAAAATGARVLQVVMHQFAPQGITALALLAESHASLHTYPEAGVAFWDCFTCGNTCDPERSIGLLVAAFKPVTIHREKVER